MSEARDQSTADILDRATLALRGVEVSDAPPSQIVSATVAALRSAASREVLPLEHQRRRVFCITRYGGLASAAALLAVIACLVIFSDRGATSAFAAVVENVKKATSVVFIAHFTSFSSASKFNMKPMDDGKVYIQGNFERMESRTDQNGPAAPYRPSDSITVGNWRTKQVLILDPKRKIAWKIQNGIPTTQVFNPIEAISNLTDKDAEFLREEKLNGRRVRVFRLLQINFLTGGTGKLRKGESGEVWVDAKNHLPVKIKAVMLSGADSTSKLSVLFENFVWNKPIDPRLFEMKVPDGFTLIDQ